MLNYGELKLLKVFDINYCHLFFILLSCAFILTNQVN